MSRLWVLVPAALCAVALVVSRRRGDRAAFRLVVLTVALNVVGVLTLAGVRGTAFPYLFYWRIPLAPLTLFASAWAIGRAVDGPWRATVRRAGTAVLALTVVVAAGVLTREVVGHPATVDPLEATVRRMTTRLARVAGDDAVLVRVPDTAVRGLQGGLFDALDRAGVDVRVDEAAAFQYGESRGATLDEVATVWYVAEDPALVSELTGLPGATVVAATSPLGTAADAELTRLHGELAAAARAAGRDDLRHREGSPAVALLFADVPGLDDTTLRRAGTLNERVLRAEVRDGACRCAVVAFAPEADPDLEPIPLP